MQLRLRATNGTASQVSSRTPRGLLKFTSDRFQAMQLSLLSCRDYPSKVCCRYRQRSRITAPHTCATLCPCQMLSLQAGLLCFPRPPASRLERRPSRGVRCAACSRASSAADRRAAGAALRAAPLGGSAGRSGRRSARRTTGRGAYRPLWRGAGAAAPLGPVAGWRKAAVRTDGRAGARPAARRLPPGRRAADATGHGAADCAVRRQQPHHQARRHTCWRWACQPWRARRTTQWRCQPPQLALTPPRPPSPASPPAAATPSCSRWRWASSRWAPWSTTTASPARCTLSAARVWSSGAAAHTWARWRRGRLPAGRQRRRHLVQALHAAAPVQLQCSRMAACTSAASLTQRAPPGRPATWPQGGAGHPTGGGGDHLVHGAGGTALGAACRAAAAPRV